MADESRSIPTGTVIFLFSDVVGSTRLWAANPDGMSTSLRIHDQIVNDTVERFSGHVFATAGDSFAVAFQGASSAVECARTIQHALGATDWGLGPAISVRIGLHLGESEERQANYFGPTLNQAARVMGVGHGGQCLLTDDVRDAAGTSTTDLGTHMLRDIETPVHLSQLGIEEFPSLAGVATGGVSLPSPRTSLIGRETSVEDVRKLLGDHQLVTLTGVGGCGKTRLSIEVAHREVRSHRDGVWFVELSATTDEHAVAAAFATALGLAVNVETALVDQIADFLSSRAALVVVDNCEHVLDEIAELLDVLIERCSQLRVLATSRESLNLAGEFTWRVPSLETGEHASAVQLFVERAAATGATLDAGEPTAAVIAEIVDRLDGSPLAIELAAARTRSMGVVEVRDRLDDRFRLLSGGSRRGLQRQATLESAVQWSYDLLTDPERSLLQTLSVFRGGFSASDAAAVAGIAEYDAIDLIDSLTAKSIVDITRNSGGHHRHRLLETIRLYALGRLIDAGDADEARDRHLEHFLNDPMGTSLENWCSFDAVTRTGREYENFRSAALWALETGRPESTSRIASIIHEAGVRRGELHLIIDWLQLDADLKPIEQMAVTTFLGWEAIWRGELDTAGTAAEAALAMNEHDPCDYAVMATWIDAVRVGALGDHTQMVQLFHDAHKLAYEYDGVNVQAVANFLLGWVDVGMLRYVDAVNRFDIALADAPHLGYRHVIEANRAWALIALGRVDEASHEVAEFSEVPTGSQWEHINLVLAPAVLAHTVGPEHAARSLAAAASLLFARRPRIGSFLLSGFAYLAHVRGDEDRAQEICALIVPTDGDQLWNWLVLKPLGATPENFHEIRASFEKQHPITERFVLDAQHRDRLLNEEFARWS